MNDEELIKEFTRWISAGRPRVWYRLKDAEDKIWLVNSRPNWGNENIYFIVDDEQAELRKHLVDNPDAKIQWFHAEEHKWIDCEGEPSWNIDTKYRVKPKPKIERRWKYANDTDGYTTIANIYMSDSFAKSSRYPENGWYKLEDDYIDVLINKEIKDE